MKINTKLFWGVCLAVGLAIAVTGCTSMGSSWYGIKVGEIYEKKTTDISGEHVIRYYDAGYDMMNANTIVRFVSNDGVTGLSVSINTSTWYFLERLYLNIDGSTIEIQSQHDRDVLSGNNLKENIYGVLTKQQIEALKIAQAVKVQAKGSKGDSAIIDIDIVKLKEFLQ